MKLILVSLTIVLVGCAATPGMTLQHPVTKQVVVCGGNSTAFGAIGYAMEQANTDKCIAAYKAQGFN